MTDRQAPRRGPHRARPQARQFKEQPVHDVIFVLLTIAFFVVLALLCRGAEKL